MRQSNGMIYSTYTWDLVQALQSQSPASCKTPSTSTDSVCPNKHRKRNKILKEISNSQQIVLYCLGLRTHDPGLREVDLELNFY